MKITRPLDNILNSEAKIKILRFLCKTAAEWNGRQIAKEVGITPATAHKALNSLNKEGVLLLYNIGKTHVYTLNENNFMVLNILKPLFAREDKILDSIISIIKQKIASSNEKEYIISVALFGSVSRAEDHPTSDIDLAVIVENSKVKTKVERLFEKIDRKISMDFGNALSPYINTKAEFKNKYKKKMAVVKNILQSHTIVYGERLETIL